VVIQDVLVVLEVVVEAVVVAVINHPNVYLTLEQETILCWIRKTCTLT